MKKLTCILLIVFTNTLAFSAEGKEVLRKIRSNYENLKSVESGMGYEIYRGFDSDEPVESYDGYFCRDGERSYRKIHQSEFFNFNDLGIFLQLDHRDQSMYLGASVAENMFETDLEKSLKMCGNIVVSEKEGLMAVSMILSKRYDLPYCRIDIEVSEDYWIRSVTLFYAAKANFSKVYNQPDMDRVRMKITYTGFNKSWHDTAGKLDSEKYLSKVGEVYEPAALYKNYAMVDTRK